MPITPNTLELQLKYTCQIAGAYWAVWMELDRGEWLMGPKHSLGKGREAALRAFLTRPKESSWLAGSLSARRMRVRSLNKHAGPLGCRRIYVFPGVNMPRVLLVGADELGGQARGFFRVLALSELPEQDYQQLAQVNRTMQENMDAQKLSESRLLRSARLAAVGELAAGVAHELNNPLTIVTGFVELVLEDLPAESPQRADLEMVLRESRRARDVVRQLLDFSRPQEDLRQNVDLNLLVQETLTLVKHWVRTRAVQISVILAEDLPQICMNANQIKQVLVNLVNNGLQAMQHGGELTIQTGRELWEGHAGLTLKVRDNGEGIPADILERLFEPFFTTRPPGSGTGLGLSVSYGIVRDHGGVIEVESQVDVGSLFTVWLPLTEFEARDA